MSFVFFLEKYSGIALYFYIFLYFNVSQKNQTQSLPPPKPFINIYFVIPNMLMRT